MANAQTAGAPAEIELRFSLGPPDAVLIDALSFPAHWLRAASTVSFAARRVACSGRAWFSIDCDPPARWELSLAGETIAARCALGARADALSRARACAGARATIAASPAGPAALNLFPKLDREVPNDAAGRAFLAAFARLDQLPQERFGAPTQEHARIAQALAEIIAGLRKLGVPNDFRVLADARAEREGCAAGVRAAWPGLGFLLVGGDIAEREFPAGERRLIVAGEGRVPIVFSERPKGITVAAYDPYGRPRTLWGGRTARGHVFEVRPGEHFVLEEA